MNRTDFRYLDRLRVRWAEVDLQKIVFNGHYLMYFDTAVAGYWRAMAMPYHETMEQLGGDLYVRKATLEYLGSARYDDVLAVGIRCGRIGNSSLRFDAAVFRGERCLVHGELLYVFADPATQSSRPVPAALRQLFEDYEAGAPMLDLRTGPWSELGRDCAALRRSVFVDELGASARLASDDTDVDALHVLARNRLGLPVACGRLARAGDGIGQPGRLATLPSLRSSGIGAQLLQTLAAAARARGDRELLVTARSDATSLYERAGFVREGEVYEEEGLPHVRLRQRL